MMRIARRRHGWGSIVLTVLVLSGAAPSASATHGVDKDCSDFASQAAAQYHMNAHPGDPDGLDGNDNDARACESNKAPYYYGSATGPEQPYALPTPSPTATPTLTAAPLRGRSQRARVVRVVDGDTLVVRLRSGSRKTVRVIGIDTPESRKLGTPVECGALRASAFMSELALRRRQGRRVGREVRLTSDPTQDATDRYGRMLAYVARSSDGLDLGRALIRAGWAMAYVYDVPFQRYARYSSEQARAKAAGRGVWGRCGGDFHRRR